MKRDDRDFNNSSNIPRLPHHEQTRRSLCLLRYARENDYREILIEDGSEVMLRTDGNATFETPERTAYNEFIIEKPNVILISDLNILVKLDEDYAIESVVLDPLKRDRLFGSN